MKRIVCEMCESTDFIKADGVFVCQGCGCKYSVDAAKKMMQEVDEQNCENNSSAEKENIPLHTPASPNEVIVKVIKTGHPEIEVVPNTFKTIMVMADGPDSAGGVSVELEITNIKGKALKYADIYVTPLNAVGDIVGCSIQKETTRCVRFTGPLEAGKTMGGSFNSAWYNHSIARSYVEYFVVEYMDGGKEKYVKGKEYMENEEPSSPKEEEIPIHSEMSDNDVHVRITAVGHEEVKLTSFLRVPKNVMTAGPDSSGGVSVALEVKNLAGKSAKYIDVYVTALNAVGDEVPCSIRKETTRCVRITGPLNVGYTTNGVFSQAWYDHSIITARIEYFIVEYMDGSKEKYIQAEAIKKEANTDKTFTIKILTKKAGKIFKASAILKGNTSEQKFPLKWGEEISVSAPGGCYTLEYDFWGLSMVPAKNRKTNPFSVDHDIYIELTYDQLRGGFKADIY